MDRVMVLLCQSVVSRTELNGFVLCYHSLHASETCKWNVK